MYCLSQASKGSTFTRVNSSVNGSVNRNLKLLCFRSYRSRPSSSSSNSSSPLPPPNFNSSSNSSNSPHKLRNKTSSKSSPKSNTLDYSPSFSPTSSPPTTSSTSSPDFIAQEIKELRKRGDFISVADVYKLLNLGKELTPSQAEEIICIVKPHKTIAPLLYVAYIRACARHGDLNRVQQAAKLCGVNVGDWASETIEGKRGIESIERVMRVKALAVKGDTVDVLLEAAGALKLRNSHKDDIFTEVISHFTITKGTMEGLETVLKEMKNANVTMNEHGFRRYLRIHVLSRDYHACLREFHKLRDNGLLVGDTGVSELITLFGSSDFGGITDLYLSEFVHSGKQPPREVYEALIKFYFHRRDNATVVRLFKEAIQTVDVSAEAFLQAFNSCAWLNPAELPELRTYISSHYWMVDTHVFNSMLETYSSKSMLDECLDLFNEMQLTVHGPNVVTYNILINHFGRTKHVDAMLALFRTMQNCNIEPDAATYAHLIFWHSQTGASSSACELLTEALSKNISISVSTFGAFADMCLAQGDEETCKKFTQQMVENGMGEVAYKALLGKYSKEGNTKKATFILNELEKHGMAVTPEIHGVMLKNIISSGDYMRCQQFVADLDSKGIRLSGRVYSELLKFYAHHDITLCVGVLQKMKEWKLTPELQAYEAILTALLKSHKFQECINVFESMKQIHLQPSTSAYNLAMSAAGKMGDLAYCSKLLEEMRKSGPFPDRFTYNTIMSHSSRARDVALLDKLREQMKQDGIPLTVVVYGILINSASRSLDVDGALKLYEEMKDNRILPDAIVFHDLMLLLLRANDHKMVMKIYSEMKENGFVPQLRLYTVLLRHLAAMKDYIGCKDLMDEMLANGVAPDAKLLSVMKKVAKEEEENEQQIAENNTNNQNEKGIVDEDLKDNVILCTTENEKENEKVVKVEDETKDDVNKDVQIFFKMCIT